ncbi:MAG: hypothetical protein KKB31_06045 [Nanoarchaeota archaeon]|nr:hypothetical protein [Nanoarchaeota archaeon]
MKKIFYGTIAKNELDLIEPDKYNLLIQSLNGCEIELTIDKRKKDRSNQQNRYYHAVVVKMIAEDLGYTKDEAHIALKMLFLLKDGKVPTVRSTTDLTTVEFEEYLRKIKRWASMFLNIYIPDPNEVDYL